MPSGEIRAVRDVLQGRRRLKPDAAWPGTGFRKPPDRQGGRADQSFAVRRPSKNPIVNVSIFTRPRLGHIIIIIIEVPELRRTERDG
jgi:hypothetical protein